MFNWTLYMIPTTFKISTDQENIYDTTLNYYSIRVIKLTLKSFINTGESRVLFKLRFVVLWPFENFTSRCQEILFRWLIKWLPFLTVKGPSPWLPLIGLTRKSPSTNSYLFVLLKRSINSFKFKLLKSVLFFKSNFLFFVVNRNIYITSF